MIQKIGSFWVDSLSDILRILVEGQKTVSDPLYRRTGIKRHMGGWRNIQLRELQRYLWPCAGWQPLGGKVPMGWSEPWSQLVSGCFHGGSGQPGYCRDRRKDLSFGQRRYFWLILALGLLIYRPRWKKGNHRSYWDTGSKEYRKIAS